MPASNSSLDGKHNPDQQVLGLPKRHLLFISLNAVIFVLTIVGVTTNDYASISTAAYIMALSLLCTLPLPLIKSFKGPESLLLVFLAYYFGAFGLKDLADLLAYEPSSERPIGSFFTDGEIAILIGVACFISAYMAFTKLLPSRSISVLNKDWTTHAILFGGVACWALGFYVTAVWQLGFGDRFSTTTINVVTGGFISLLRMLQPVGTLLLIYLYLTSRNKIVLAALVATMIADFGLGFVGDSKQIAIRGPILYLFSIALMRERVPIVTMIIFMVITGIAFSLFASYRGDLHSHQQSRQEALENIGDKLQTLSEDQIPLARRLSEGLDYFASRITLKQNMDLILSRTGKDVAFQDGATLSPLLYAFIPRFIAPNKPESSATGRIFNREFDISGDPDTYISVGQLGELYWNYGWPGLVIGMLMIGAIMAMLGLLLRLDRRPTLPKFLILLMTIYLLALRFEAALAMTYTVWARALVLLLILNAFMPKRTPEHEKSDSLNVSAITERPTGKRILKRAHSLRHRQ